MFRHSFKGEEIASHFGRRAEHMGKELLLTCAEDAEEHADLAAGGEGRPVKPIPEPFLAKMREHVQRNGTLPGHTFEAWA